MKFEIKNSKLRQRAGFATLIVFILLMIVVGLAMDNALTLSRLKREIQQVERDQVKKYRSHGAGRAAGTVREPE